MRHRKESLRVKAMRLLKSEVKLVVEPNSESAMAALLTASETLTLWRGTLGTNYCGIVFEPAIANEAITAPHIRVAPFQKLQFGKLIAGVLKARTLVPEDGGAGAMDAAEGGHIAAGDMYITLDGGKAGPIGTLDAAMLRVGALKFNLITTTR